MAVYDVLYEKLLFRRIADGDEHAFQEFFDLYKARVYAFVKGYTHAAADAEEILQDTFLIIWEKKSTLTQVEHPRNYLYTMVRNKTFNFLKRAAKSEKMRQEIWAHMQLAHNPTQDALYLQESNQLLEAAVGRLSEKKQLIFKLSRYEGLNHEQIADKTGLSRSRVKNILVEVMKSIKTYMTEYTSLWFF